MLGLVKLTRSFRTLHSQLAAIHNYLKLDVETLKDYPPPLEEFKLILETQERLTYIKTILKYRNSWKLFAHSEEFKETYLKELELLSLENKKELIASLLELGISKKVFLEKDNTVILNHVNQISKLDWGLIKKVSLFMKVNNFYNWALVDKIAQKCLSEKPQISTLVLFLRCTWKSGPVNYELEQNFRERIARELNYVSKTDIPHTLNLLLRSGVKHQMFTILKLLSQVTPDYIESLKSHQLLLVLFSLVKCRRHQIQVPDNLFEVISCQIKDSIHQRNSKQIDIIARGFSEINFKDGHLYHQLKQKAESLGDPSEFLQYLIDSVEPSIETI